MKFPTPARGLLLACSLSLPVALMSTALADTLKLKDGTTLEGVATDVPEGIKFTWRPTPSIKEEKVFKTSEIAEIKRLAPDELEIPALRKLVPTGDMVSATDYTKTIEGKLKPFLQKYPTSKLGEEVKGILKTYEEELEKINNGWQKLDGAWISPEEDKWNRYNIAAKILRKEMQDEVAKKNTKEALDKFMKLKAEYLASPAFVEALDIYNKMLDDYDRELLRQIQEFPARMKELEERKATLSKAEADEVALAIKKRLSDLKLKVDAEKKDKTPILSSDEYDLNTLKTASTSVAKERLTVSTLIRDKKKYEEAAEMVSKAFAESGKGNAQMAFTILEQALKKDVLRNDAKLKGRLLIFKEANDEAQKAAPKPVVSTTPKGDPAPANSSKPTTAAKPNTEKKKPVERVKPAASTDEEPVVEEESNIGLIAGAIGGAALLLGGLWFMKSRKKDDNED